ncbi:hypothetical protein ADUPG1_014187, partial [Aduncisulcus paluster]
METVKLFIGKLPPSYSVPDLKECFRAFFVETGHITPIFRKRIAFTTCNTDDPEGLIARLDQNITFHGHKLKVARDRGKTGRRPYPHKPPRIPSPRIDGTP